MKSKEKFILITLGEELLLGLTRNGHLTYIGEQLRRRGVTLHSNLTISDEGAEIEEQFKYCWEKGDVVITTGGLGPTVDDRTKETIAKVLGDELILDQEILDTIQKRFRAIGRKMTDNNKKQAYRPSSAEVLENPNGTAPGLWMEKEGKILAMLPGPPAELQPMFEYEVLPRLEKRGLIRESEDFVQLRTIGIGESALEIELQPLFEEYEDLEVAYCAHQGQVDLRITFSNATDRDYELLELANRCKERLGPGFLSFGHDSLVKIVSDRLTEIGGTLAIAEHRTGGYLASELKKISSSSDCFLGGIVVSNSNTYSGILNVGKELIQQHSLASSKIAETMAKRVATNFGADYGLAVTDFSMFDEGDSRGGVYVGLHSPQETTATRVVTKNAILALNSRVLNASFDLLRRNLIAELSSKTTTSSS